MDKQEIVFIDANIFLEVMLEDSKSESCIILLNEIETLERQAKTSDFIIYTCLLQIQHKLKSMETMKRFILFINALKGLEIIRPTLKNIYDTMKISEKYKLDFDDSLVISCMVNNKIKKLISLDKDFDKVDLIKREEP